MKVLFISRNSPFESIGGIERYLTNLIEFYKNKEETSVFILLPTYKERSTEKQGNVTIYFDPSIAIPKDSSNIQRVISKNAHVFSDRVKEIIKQDKIDIIVGENIHTDLPAAFNLHLNMIAISNNIPLVLQMHSFANTELQMELVNQLKWNQISCVSKSVAGDCFQKGADINFLSIHYLGVNNKKFNVDITAQGSLKKKLNLAETDKIILTATRIIRGKTNSLQKKGVINLIEAFSKLSPRYPNLKLLIAIGKSRADLQVEFDVTYENLKGYVKLHNVEENTILKQFEMNEMPQVYSGSDVFVLPSENETFGQVFIEAMSCGLPVIGTKVGGIPEIISDSYNGFLIPPNDSSVLAQRIERLLNDTSIRNKFISAGIKTVESIFTTEKQLADFRKMLEDTVATAKSLQ